MASLAKRQLKINPNTEYELMSSKKLRSGLTTLPPMSQAYRANSIRKIRAVAREYSLSPVIVCTALTYFDLSLQRASVEQSIEDFEAFGLVSLLLATKFHEGCQAEPKASSLAKRLRTQLQEKVMKQVELRIATSLYWSLDVQTPVHFINYFINRGNIL